MTTETHDLLRRQVHAALDEPEEAPFEWLVTNGLGGYASGSVDGPPMRRFHGLLVAAHPAPVGRVLMLHDLDEVIDVDETTTLALRPESGASGVAARTEFFLLAGLPHWTFELAEGVRLVQGVCMPHGQNTVHVRYRLLGRLPHVRLRVTPWLDFRAHEGRLSPTQEHGYGVTQVSPSRCEFTREGPWPVLRMWGADGQIRFVAGPENRNQQMYEIERDRGYDHLGSMHAPGVFELDLTVDRDACLSASTEEWDAIDALRSDDAWQSELTRRESLVASSHPALQTADTFLLPLAADQFVVRPATRAVDDAQAHAFGAEPRTVIAGYPWFTDWGRDTMISLEGLTLVSGRHREAHDILRTFALHVRHGLIPNLFPEGERQGLYHTADATLWFFHAIHRYDAVTGDHSLVHELLPVLENIIACHRRGTLFNIRMDADGLLAQGADGLQLTWMDAKVDDWVVTPRRGKAVEINALWHNALCLLAAWLRRADRAADADAVDAVAATCRDSFNARFWNPDTQHLYDIVDGETGDDNACRPNQLIALAVAHPPLRGEYRRPVLDTVVRELLTPVGLRTLSRRHPDYKARYFGDLRARDSAYHQGTVWPWLIGPLVDAWLAVHPDDTAGAREVVAPLLRHMTSSACIGSISEVFDAELPFTPRGCHAQAWSVAELARVVVRLAAPHATGPLDRPRETV